jgi:hypothetical protein
MEFLVRVHGHTDVDSPFRVAYGTNVDSRGSGDPRGGRAGRKKFMAKGYVPEIKCSHSDAFSKVLYCKVPGIRLLARFHMIQQPHPIRVLTGKNTRFLSND